MFPEIYGSYNLNFKNLQAYFPQQFWVVSSGNRCVQLCAPNAKAAYTSLYTYSNGCVKAWSLILSLSCHDFFVIFERRNHDTVFWVLLYLFKKKLNIKSPY